MSAIDWRNRENMTVAVRYLSKTGNTKKLAKAIGEAVGAQEEDLLSPIREPVEILFLGSAVYAAGIDEKVKKYLEENREQIGAIAAFSTAALISGTYRQLRRLCLQLEIPLMESEYHCKGKFGPMHNGRPNKKDCEDAAQWARTILEMHD
jgi:flavodoxin